jgi:hypothetical protein
MTEVLGGDLKPGQQVITGQLAGEIGRQSKRIAARLAVRAVAVAGAGPVGQ